jgi:hypothetical protein
MKIGNFDITLGADPEILLQKDGQPCTAWGLIPGTKHEPYFVGKGAVQVDGMALEFNINPSSTEDEFEDNILSMKKLIMDMVPGYEELKGCTAEFTKEYLSMMPSEALELGCEPDYDGKTGRRTPKPNGAMEIRTAGGHVHIGGFYTDYELDRKHFKMCRDLSKIMDAECGIYSLIWDDDDKRRLMYGKSSAFRPKTYGMEYRTMSNKWIFNPKLIRLIYKFTIDAVTRLVEGDTKVDDEVFSIIDSSDRSSKFFRNNKKADMIYEAIGA